MQITKLINASAGQVWEILIDTQLWPVWGPSVKAVACPQRYIAAGVEGQLKTPFGLWAGFTITEFEPLHFWAWKVSGVPATGHRIRSVGNESCELIFELPFAVFPYALICRQAANRIASLALAEKPENE